MAVSFRSRAHRSLRSIFDDALYRGSLTLLANTAATAVIGFVFWSLAAHRYPASAVGVFSSVTAGAGLLAAIAALGFPNVITRHVASIQNARELVAVAVIAIATVGTGLCLVSVLVLGPHLPPSLDLQQRGRTVLLVTGLVVFIAVSSIFDAGLVATRASHAVLIKNVAGSIVKVVAMLLLVSFPSAGLVIAYGLGLLVTTVLGSISLGRRVGGRRVGVGSFRLLRRYLSITSGNYIASIMGILPVSVVPILVLVVRGAAETGRFAVAFLIAGFLFIIPSTVARVLFAEASRQGVPLREQLRKAIRGIYALLLPAVVDRDRGRAAATPYFRVGLCRSRHRLPPGSRPECVADGRDIPRRLAPDRTRPNRGVCFHERRERRSRARPRMGTATARPHRSSGRVGAGAEPSLCSSG